MDENPSFLFLGDSDSWWKTRTLNWFRLGFYSTAIACFMVGILELIFPTARWLNCGAAMPYIEPYIEPLVGRPSCVWDWGWPLWFIELVLMGGGIMSIMLGSLPDFRDSPHNSGSV